jgi:hypothetical protein
MGSTECFFHAEEVPKEVRETWGSSLTVVRYGLGISVSQWDSGFTGLMVVRKLPKLLGTG